LIDELGVSPSQIMMITFTNKAATEIKNRMMDASSEAHKMWIGTFHRICTRLIRMFGAKLGIQSFVIMDTKEGKNLIREILNDRGVEYSPYMVNEILAKISSYKNNLIKPAAVLASQKERQLFADVYQEYQNICWKRKTFDFDDLIIYTILLLSSYPDITDWVHENIKYLMVDETQDTNSAQFQLVKLITGDNNVMIVGDSNQSIYAFRNARPEYLENFASAHPNTKLLKLEQNYRSSQTIIEAANAMINHNSFGTKVQMFCDNDAGDKVQIYQANDIFTEARWISSEIMLAGSKNFSNFAIIYRANAQARIIEEEFTKFGINYTVFGSQSFYTRKEVRDLLAYCKCVVNNTDMTSFKRILGTLKGVGKVTIENIIDYAQNNCLNFHDVIPAYIKSHKISANIQYRLESVSRILAKEYTACSDILKDVIDLTDYRKEIAMVYSEDTAERLSIIDEFVVMTASMEANTESDTMGEIIDQIALLSETKGAEKAELNAVKLMTAHSSKGLEFDTVFIIGAEEGVFPHANSLNENTKNAIEEERRLFYVAMTRAKRKLYITRAAVKKNGKDSGYINTRPSRFLNEIPKHLTEDAF